MKQERNKENVAEGTGSTLNHTEPSSAEAVFTIPDILTISVLLLRVQILIISDMTVVTSRQTKSDLSPMRVKTGFWSPVTHT